MKDYEYEKLFDYYSMLQYTIDEADKANRGTMFLIAFNIDEEEGGGDLEKGEATIPTRRSRPGFRRIPARTLRMVYGSDVWSEEDSHQAAPHIFREPWEK
jgi:hypothetical protein